MAQSPIFHFPAPDGDDSPDVPRDILALANAVDASLATEQSTRFNNDNALGNRITAVQGAGWDATKTIMDLYTKVPANRVKVSAVNVTSNSAGDATITHNAGWVPSVFLITPYSSSSSNPHVNVTVDTRVLTATQIGVNLWNVKADAPYNASIGLSFYLRD